MLKAIGRRHACRKTLHIKMCNTSKNFLPTNRKYRYLSFICLQPKYIKLKKKKKKLLASSCLSVRLHGTRLSLDGFSWNLIFKYFSKICQRNSSLIILWPEQQVLHVKMYVHLRFLLRSRNVSDKRCRENQNMYFIFNIFLIVSVMRWCGKTWYSQTGHR
jgi:hypothetical protein